ncbi:hypothetical protein BSKO_04339 [Bryopsis sp. KO-2023]|nr:hypothetical protein BSKO_04339 [Bryopsis sp. KO-2023]
MVATAFAVLETHIHVILFAIFWTSLECCLSIWWRKRRGDKLAAKERELRRFEKGLKQRERSLVSRQMRLYNEQEEIRADLEVEKITLSGQLAQEREALQRWQDMLENQEKELQRKVVEEEKKHPPTLPFTFSAGADEYDEHQRRRS